ncbi:YebC/PmpR family DNA-binding transcriptional regulator [bacterium]|jgi:YebC/PmpR family DNA-binding regulatory protein|nr:YebC/PmpR family DNA-binding transcriptional regulator [bacterium]
MGRAYEVRKASIQKTGAAKGKVYTTFAKEIYLAAKKGSPNPEANVTLKRLIDKAKKNQVPSDIITRAIDKAKGVGQDEYHEVVYEGFGPGASTLIIKCLTDNVNRTVGMVRAAFNKVNKSLGVTNSVSYNYDHLGIISFKYENDDEILEVLLNAGIEIVDIEKEDGYVTVSLNPSDMNSAKDEIEKIIPNVDYEIDEVGMYAKDKITLEGEDKEIFDRLYNILEDIEDVSQIYTNVSNIG